MKIQTGMISNANGTTWARGCDMSTFSLGEGTFMLFKQLNKDLQPSEHVHICLRLIDGKIDPEWAQSLNTKMKLPEYGNDMHLAIVESKQDDCGDWAAGSLTQRWRVATWVEYELAMDFIHKIAGGDKAGQILIGLLKNEIRELRINEIGI